MLLLKAGQFKSVWMIGGLFVLSGLFALLVAMGAEHILHLEPCELCLWERRPWKVLIAFGVLVLVLGPRYARWPALFGVLCVLVSVGLSAMHIGVEQGWWPSPAAECQAHVVYGQSFENWMQTMPLRPAKPCDLPDYPFGLPISLTILSGVYAFGVFVLSLWGLRHLFRDVKRQH
ncbi:MULTISPECIES: disulfide bond formation protein B [unclassified Saccharibacter]|uniref:disulfide bond formation protein B n=1 Tax=unclassified Saccharibacter TaxID=2648722 RepID=UPI0013225A8F|nr:MULTISPECIES: disulfide bond formation protein B [unclassified Saccharibacter]MXV36363.1 disulfide bond formation protein B [Saccharibacter sp. EH611]MXV57525.1 disulfide bond formation protein B [Saccharibacter sp. EH70]MXV65168.1 disulfide bond formation protein B [Saccharibacter sp. EH60]